MRDEVTRLRGNFQLRRKNGQVYPKTCCERCGMTEAEHRQVWGKQLLQLHHIIGISTFVDQGVTDPNIVNNVENLSTLCYFCHKEWHTFAEPLQLDYRAWMQRQPVFDLMGRTPPSQPLQGGHAMFNRKARLKHSSQLL